MARRGLLPRVLSSHGPSRLWLLSTGTMATVYWDHGYCPPTRRVASDGASRRLGGVATGTVAMVPVDFGYWVE